MNANRTSRANRRAACTLAVLVLVSTVCSVAQNNAEDPRAVLQRGVDLLREGRHEEALHALEDAKRALPGRAQIDNLLGIALTKLGRVPEANEHFRGAIALNPKLAEAHKNLGFNYWTAGRNEEAEKSFQAARPPKAEAFHLAARWWDRYTCWCCFRSRRSRRRRK